MRARSVELVQTLDFFLFFSGGCFPRATAAVAPYFSLQLRKFGKSDLWIRRWCVSLSFGYFVLLSDRTIPIVPCQSYSSVFSPVSEIVESCGERVKRERTLLGAELAMLRFSKAILLERANVCCASVFRSS